MLSTGLKRKLLRGTLTRKNIHFEMQKKFSLTLCLKQEEWKLLESLAMSQSLSIDAIATRGLKNFLAALWLFSGTHTLCRFRKQNLDALCDNDPENDDRDDYSNSTEERSLGKISLSTEELIFLKKKAQEQNLLLDEFISCGLKKVLAISKRKNSKKLPELRDF